MGSRVAANNALRRADLACFLLPFPSLLSVRAIITCKRRKTQCKVSSSLLFSDLLFSIFSFWFVVLPFFRWRICQLLLPFSFASAAALFKFFSSLFSPSLGPFDFCSVGRSSDCGRELSVWFAAKAGVHRG